MKNHYHRFSVIHCKQHKLIPKENRIAILVLIKKQATCTDMWYIINPTMKCNQHITLKNRVSINTCIRRNRIFKKSYRLHGSITLNYKYWITKNCKNFLSAKFGESALSQKISKWLLNQLTKNLLSWGWLITTIKPQRKGKETISLVIN